MNSGKIVADGTGGRDGTSKVLQEVLADLKNKNGGKLLPQAKPEISTDTAYDLGNQRGVNFLVVALFSRIIAI